VKEFQMLKHFMSVTQLAARLRADDRGVTSVEYGLMVALIAIVIIGAVTLLGTNLSNLFNQVANAI
jgi:pilus assembly protein Flp/PilA